MNLQNKICILLIINLLGVFLNQSFAQDSTFAAYQLPPFDKNWKESDQRFYEAVSQVWNLKKNTLVVVLRTNSRKLSQLRALMSNADLTDDERKNLQKTMASVVEETTRFNRQLYDAFRYRYRFSRLFFVMDIHLERLQKGETSGFFVNENLQIDPAIQLSSPDFLFCFFKIPSAASSVEGLVIEDKNLKTLAPPFPSVTVARSSGFYNLLQIFSKKTDRQEKILHKNLEQLQQGLYDLLLKGIEKFPSVQD